MWSEDDEEAAVPAANPNLQLTLDLGPGTPQPLSPSNHKSPSSGRLGGLNRFCTSWAPSALWMPAQMHASSMGGRKKCNLGW